MRLAIIGPATSTGGFNPRICKRCDAAQKEENRLARVSIHASVKDATPAEA